MRWTPVTKRPKTPRFHRAILGGGNALKAVTSAKRSAASRQLGVAPGRAPGPAIWRAHRRKAVQAATRAIEQAQAREDQAA